MNEWLTVTEYAAVFAVSRNTVYKWLEAGLLESFKVERTIRLRNIPPVHPVPSCQVATGQIVIVRAK